MTVTREQIAEAALSLHHVRFAHQGRDESLGLDCAGVLVAAFRKCGVELREEKVNYRRLPAEDHIRRCLEMNFVEVNFEISPQPVVLGHIVHLKLSRDTAARHLGIIVEVAGDLMLVHAVRHAGEVLLEPFRAVLNEATIAGVYQYPGVF